MKTITKVERFRKMVDRAMEDSRLCLWMSYADKGGHVTERTVAPVRWVKATVFTAICLGRESVRAFDVRQVESMKFRLASDILAPEPVIEIG